MVRLKADLHTHSADDARDVIGYSSESLIDAAAVCGVEVLAIAGHQEMVYSPRLANYAAGRGVLLLPAVERSIEGKHVVMLNPDRAQAAASTFKQLRVLGRRDAAFVAPHPFYRLRSCLGGKLVEHIDLFDAVEYCSLYAAFLNPNRKAARVAARFDLPMVGTSDTHVLPYDDSTFSWIGAEERTVEGVIQAIRSGRVTVETRPRPLSQAIRMAAFCAHDTMRLLWGLQ